MSEFFNGFDTRRVTVDNGADLFVRSGGAGPPLLLLHGYPQNHVIWHLVAPVLAEHFSLVIPDLRGYGASRGPAPDSKHLNYSKRSMAQDIVELMTALGHERFALAGHDRGGLSGWSLSILFQRWQRSNKWITKKRLALITGCF